MRSQDILALFEESLVVEVELELEFVLHHCISGVEEFFELFAVFELIAFFDVADLEEGKMLEIAYFLAVLAFLLSWGGWEYFGEFPVMVYHLKIIVILNSTFYPNSKQSLTNTLSFIWVTDIRILMFWWRNLNRKWKSFYDHDGKSNFVFMGNLQYEIS